MRLQPKTISHLIPLLSSRNLFCTAQPKYSFFGEADLRPKNSNTNVLRIMALKQGQKKPLSIEILLDKDTTFSELRLKLKSNAGIEQAEFICNEGFPIGKACQVDSLMPNYFYIITPNSKILVEGAALAASSANTDSRQTQISRDLDSLELPAILLKQLRRYLLRVSKWLEGNHGVDFTDASTSIKADKIQQILIEASVDPQYPAKTVMENYIAWKTAFEEVTALRKLKAKAVEMSEQTAKTRMYGELAVLLANVGCIWSGTYIYFSWDIMEPIAYFSSSLVSIILINRYRKTLKMYTPTSYKSYLAGRYLQDCYQHVGLNIDQLQQKEEQLKELEEIWKNYLIAQL